MAGLTDLQVRKAQPAEKPFRMADEKGLFLFVTPAGAKLWRLRYRRDGKEQTLSLGAYPDMTLAEARTAADQARGVLKAGKDPALVKKIDKLVQQRQNGETFEPIAREWHDLQNSKWAPIHASDVLTSLESDVFPAIGSLPIRDIDETIVLATLRVVEKRGAVETARRLRQRISAVFCFAIATGRANRDPAAVVKGALAPLVPGRQPAVVSLDEARLMLRRVEDTPSHPVTKLAVRLLALTVPRPGTLAKTPWAEFDEIDDADPVWVIPAERMKLKQRHKGNEAFDHVIPLSRQALEVIDALRALTGSGPYVFPNARHAHRPMSENAMGYLLNRAGYFQRHVPHGFRATFSSVMNERFPADRYIIDAMLAHVPKDKVEAAYNRAQHLKRRRELAQEWADLILKDAPSAAELLGGPRKILSMETFRRKRRSVA
ncbi:integrase arm-type DNA-binding domain-containing protein [Ciceribacter sp. L1K22]|uniref:tyrosine-type recombinase/integrase n=1 Tax=Ciceribacter sp. L1K22 TaxID=2820275 RepID=UPI001ABDD57F|nr:integrase arm-type DNA-binding domain-containing protein [Ciceribacter sp. L1K22]MBO3760336.1 integrase arm-type DNA-binding domain-containing protein [Ciceribacter sp. L1K22]